MFQLYYVKFLVCVELYKGESNENLKSYIELQHRYLRFSFGSLLYTTKCVIIVMQCYAFYVLVTITTELLNAQWL